MVLSCAVSSPVASNQFLGWEKTFTTKLRLLPHLEQRLGVKVSVLWERELFGRVEYSLLVANYIGLVGAGLLLKRLYTTTIDSE